VGNPLSPETPTPAAATTPETPAVPSTTPTSDATFVAPAEGSPLATAKAAEPGSEASPPAEPGEKSAEGEAEPPALPPSADDYKIEFPEGTDVDAELLGKFTAFAFESKLTNEQAQGLANLYQEGITKAAESLATATQAAWTKTIDTWKGEIAADTEIGSGNEQAVQAALGAALDEFGTPETRAAFELTGSGWNPHIIKFVYNMAKALTEGQPVTTGNPAGKAGPRTLGNALYENQGQQ
jgi:hypothetical protein